MSVMTSSTLWFWTRGAGYGLLLGVSIAVLEVAYYSPLVTANGHHALAPGLSVLLSWSGEGVSLGLVVCAFERRKAPHALHAWNMALAVVVASTVGVAAWQAVVLGVLRQHLGVRVMPDYVNQPVDLLNVIFYHAWLMLLFGGLAVAVQFSRQRNARMLAVLREAQLARERTQGRLAEAQLAALRAQIDPQFLLQSLTDLERLYRDDPAEAARRLDQFIVFLRSAVAAARTVQPPARIVSVEVT